MKNFWEVKTMQTKFHKKSFFTGFFTIIMVFGILTITAFSNIPAKVHLIEGEEQEFSWKLPLTADIDAQMIDVVSSDTEPVEGNIHSCV